MSKLKRVREKTSLSQSELAAKSGVSVRMIQNYEQGVRDVNKAQAMTVYNLIRALDCTLQDILEIDNI